MRKIDKPLDADEIIGLLHMCKIAALMDGTVKAEVQIPVMSVLRLMRQSGVSLEIIQGKQAKRGRH